MLTSEQKNVLVKGVLKSDAYAAWLSDYPSIVREIRFDNRLLNRCRDDPVFFAVLYLNMKWLIDPKAEKHRQVLRDPSLSLVIVCGRGWGKTLTIAIRRVWRAFTCIKNYAVIASAGMRQSMEMFSYIENLTVFNPVLQDLVMPRGKGTTRTQIMLRAPFYSKIQALPCSKDKLRGKHPDDLVIDEAGIVPSEMITGELMMMLTRDDCRLEMIGTPKALDHAFKKKFDSSTTGKYHAASDESPLVSSNRLQEWKALMSRDEWEREVEAKWSELQSTFFPMEMIVGKGEYVGCVDAKLEYLTDYVTVSPDLKSRVLARCGSHPRFGGFDAGKKADNAAFTCVFVSDNQTYGWFFHEFPLHTKYSDCVAYVAEFNRLYPMTGFEVDQTGGASSAITEQFIDAGISEDVITGIDLSDQKKDAIWGNLHLMSERGAARIPAFEKLITQMNQQQVEYSRKANNEDRLLLLFHHPSGAHDDLFCSYALAVHAATGRERITSDTSKPIMKGF